MRNALPLCAAALLGAGVCAAAQGTGLEEALDPKGRSLLGIAEVEFRSIESVTAKSPVLTIVGRALVSTFCRSGRCPSERRAYDRVTLVIDTNKRGFQGGAPSPSKTEWGRHVMTKSLAACGRLAAEARDFSGDYIQVGIFNAHDYETTVFRRSASEARIEYSRILDANRADGLDCSVSFIDKGKADPNEMAWPPVPPAVPAHAGSDAPARFSAAFIPLSAPRDFQEDMRLFVGAFIEALQGAGAYAVMEHGKVAGLLGASASKGAVSRAAVLKLGKTAGTDQVLVPRAFFSQGGGWTVSVDCFDVATGKQVATARGTCPGCVPGGGSPEGVARGMANAIRKKLKMPLWTPPPQ